MKSTVILIILFTHLSSCLEIEIKPIETESISPTMGDSLFSKINTLIPINPSHKVDTISILFLPIDASCLSCRNKVIKNILAFREKLNPNQYFVFTASNEKLINAFIRNENIEINKIHNIIIDKDNIAFRTDLVFIKPIIYYSSKGRIYKKVALTPKNIDQELKLFFLSKDEV